ncbi:hypothetical protein F5Y11DRAFT_328839 [Daldinia sp. FL1419]|nr:hypothetical protein F5Y11DRAFT_328839 [Daldinia sp. FL1419]
MPIPVAAKVGVVALTVAVAAAVAVYESPELQRMASDLRRRIAIALHALGDSVSPAERENLFNRPEDAEGFLRSRGFGVDGEPGVDADDETRRRQREELLYWNAVRESKKEKESSDPEKAGLSRPRASTSGSSFDDFMQEDNNAEKGAFVFQTGSELQNTDGLLRRRGEGARGLAQSIYTNPFTDEHGIDEHIAFENSLVDPEKDEVESDIYSASTQLDAKSETPRLTPLSPAPIEVIPPLISIEDRAPTTQTQLAQTSERELGPDEYMTAGQDDRNAYSSIQAWAHDASTASFYSPLPVSPAGPLSDAESFSEGALTPPDSASLAGSGEDLGDDAVSARSWTEGRHYDVMSDDEGMMTPASWTEVGSVVSESDAGVGRHN